MPIPLRAALYLGVDAARLRAQGVQCPYSTGNVVVLSAMRDAVADLYLEGAKLPVSQATIAMHDDGWDRSAIDLPPCFKKLRSGKLERAVVVFESSAAAKRFSERSFYAGERLAWLKR